MVLHIHFYDRKIHFAISRLVLSKINLLYFTEDILKKFHEGLLTETTRIYLQKTFDTTNHKFLLQQL